MNRLTIKSPSGLIHLKDNTEKAINTAIKKLSDFEDLEEQGKLLKLPCAVEIRCIECIKSLNYLLIEPMNVKLLG